MFKNWKGAWGVLREVAESQSPVTGPLLATQLLGQLAVRDPKKPRIKRFTVRPGGLIELLVLPPNWKDIRYECRGAGRVGYGESPLSAYRQWASRAAAL